MEFADANAAIAYADDLKKEWGQRNTQITEWYNQIKLTDTLYQKGQESYVSNEPRVFLNMARHLLCKKVPHRIPLEGLNAEQIQEASEIERWLALSWVDQDRISQRRGRQSWMWNLVGLALTTGWISVFATVTDNRTVADIWNPMEVYPDFGDDELIGCAHIYELTGAAAKRKIITNGWTWPATKQMSAAPKLYDIFYMNDSGEFWHCILMDGEFMVNPEKLNTDFIPVIITPISGLPDTGQIDSEWRKFTGESVTATNKGVYEKYNRHLSFSAQLLRSIAQTRWFESSRNKDILSPENMDKMGAIFKGDIGDTVQALVPPAAPVELRMDRYDMQQEIQRGSLPWSLAGTSAVAMTGYMMALTASVAQQNLKPFHDAIIYTIGEVDMIWLKTITAGQKQPLSPDPKMVKLPKEASKYTVSADYALEIPGDLVQRVTAGRMMNPNFRVSCAKTLDLLFPEIENPLKEEADARAEDALRSPISILIDQISAYKTQAAFLRKAKQSDMAALYENAAAALEKQITASGNTPPPTPGAGATPGTVGEWNTGMPGGQSVPGARPEAMPNRGPNAALE